MRPKIVGDGWKHPTVIDIAGLKVLHSGLSTPVLYAHDRKDLIGRTTCVNLLPDRITAEGILGIPGPSRDLILSAARSGFWWGVSMGVEPDDVFFLPSEKKVFVNQREIWGPVNIVLSGTLMDISLLPAGADKEAWAQIIRVNGRFDLCSRIADWGRTLVRAQVDEAPRIGLPPKPRKSIAAPRRNPGVRTAKNHEGIEPLPAGHTRDTAENPQFPGPKANP